MKYHFRPPKINCLFCRFIRSACLLFYLHIPNSQKESLDMIPNIFKLWCYVLVILLELNEQFTFLNPFSHQFCTYTQKANCDWGKTQTLTDTTLYSWPLTSAEPRKPPSGPNTFHWPSHSLSKPDNYFITFSLYHFLNELIWQLY